LTSSASTSASSTSTTSPEPISARNLFECGARSLLADPVWQLPPARYP